MHNTDSQAEKSESQPNNQQTTTEGGQMRVCRTTRLGIQFCIWAIVLVFFVETVAAANGLTLAKGSRDTLAVPQWLYLATGGATIGASALLASFVTDRAFIRYLHKWNRPLIPANRRWGFFTFVGRGIGISTLILVVYLGYEGPQLPNASFTILLTFAGGRAALPMVAYLIGNVWPTLNPWRTLALALPTGFRTYPSRFKRWPAVIGLLMLVWVEVIFPVSAVPTVLAAAILAYSAVTLAGAVVFGLEPWFENADPLAVLFRLFGAVAPLQRRGGTLQVKVPGSELADAEILTDKSDVAFVIALIWELTYSGFITTSPGAATINSLVGIVPVEFVDATAQAIVVYSVLFAFGYLSFFAAYWYAADFSRGLVGTYVTTATIRLRFAPPLLAIAAGYHLAHYAGLFVSLSPALVIALQSPLMPPTNPIILALPSWFGGLAIASILIGHLFAIWAAHAVSYELFSSRLVAIRSQYPFIIVMVGYTVISLWIISLPGANPPYLL